jgi:hypothetical protein
LTADDRRIAPTVRRFIADHVQSAELLEVLLLLFRTADRWWSAEGVAQELHMSPRSTANRLEDLASRRFLDARVAETVMFRYKPVSAALEAMVADLARLHSEAPMEVARMVGARATEEILGFADAFRIRKRNNDG